MQHCTTSPPYDSSPVRDELWYFVPHSRKTFLGISNNASQQLQAHCYGCSRHARQMALQTVCFGVILSRQLHVRHFDIMRTG